MSRLLPVAADQVGQAQRLGPMQLYGRYVKAAIAVFTFIGTVAWIVNNKKSIGDFFNKSILSDECETISNILTTIINDQAENLKHLFRINTEYLQNITASVLRTSSANTNCILSFLFGLEGPRLNSTLRNISTPAINSTPEITQVSVSSLGTSLNETNHEDIHTHADTGSVTTKSEPLPNEEVTHIDANSTSSQPTDIPPEPQPDPIVSVQQLEPNQQIEVDYEAVAKMIGISKQYLLKNADFARFIVANSIHLNLKNFGDKVTVGRYGIPTLTIHGKAGSWNLLKDRIPIDKETGKLVGRVYTQNGFEPI